MSIYSKPAPSAAEIAVEKECIMSGFWPKTATAEITDALGDQDPTSTNIGRLIADRRKASPEEFLSRYEQREVDRGPEPDRFVRSYKAILKVRDRRGSLSRRQAKAMGSSKW